MVLGGLETLAVAPSPVSTLAAAGCLYWRAMSSGVLPELAWVRVRVRVRVRVKVRVRGWGEG
jgi:hypothetical protein